MNNLYKKWIKIAFVAFALSTTFLSCKKKEVEPPKVETIEKVSIVDLKVFYAKLINVKETSIAYNVTNETFTVSGKDPISKEKLTRIYNNIGGKNE